MAEDVPASKPKKRSLFKRAAWQDAPKDEDGDMFSHSKEFPDMIAAENRRREEAARKRKQAEERGRKRRKVSSEAPTEPGSGSIASRSSKKERSSTPISPVPARSPPDSLAARYDDLVKPTAANNSRTQKESLVIELDDEDEDESDDKPSYPSQSHKRATRSTHKPWEAHKEDIAIRPVPIPIADDDELEEVLDPTLAALAARARERAALKARSAALAVEDGEPSETPVVQLFIQPEIPDTRPLLVKVRIDSTTEKVRQAWCGKQGFTPDKARTVFFTNKGMRIYDSTTIKRLGVIMDAYGNVSLEGDLTIYDDENLPKITVEAWTEELFKKRKAEEAAEAAAVKKAAEAPLIIDRTPTPEPEPKVKKMRVKLRAKGKPEFGIHVKMDTTFGHLATAYKKSNKIDKDQPITLMFDGERLMPLDTIADVDIEDMDSIDVLFK